MRVHWLINVAIEHANFDVDAYIYARFMAVLVFRQVTTLVDLSKHHSFGLLY